MHMFRNRETQDSDIYFVIQAHQGQTDAMAREISELKEQCDIARKSAGQTSQSSSEVLIPCCSFSLKDVLRCPAQVRE